MLAGNSDQKVYVYVVFPQLEALLVAISPTTLCDFKARDVTAQDPSSPKPCGVEGGNSLEQPL